MTPLKLRVLWLRPSGLTNSPTNPKESTMKRKLHNPVSSASSINTATEREMNDAPRGLTLIILILMGMGLWGYTIYTQEARIAYLEQELERNLTK